MSLLLIWGGIPMEEMLVTPKRCFHATHFVCECKCDIQVGMNCERYSSLLDYYSASTKMVTRKMLQFDKKRIQVLVNAQCIGACAVFARLASQEGFATVVGIGIDSVGTAPAAISGDIDGLVCQQKGMKLDEDNIPASQLVSSLSLAAQDMG